MRSWTKIDNRKKDILILDKGPTQSLERTLIAEKMYSINFTEKSRKFCLSFHYNKENSYLFVNGTEIHKFKSKDSEILPYFRYSQVFNQKKQYDIKMFGFIKKCFLQN